MELIRTVEAIRAASRAARAAGARIGLVPTMGALHEGHLTLVRAAAAACTRVVVSIFVNPTQFGAGEDFASYPRDLKRDLELLRREGVAAVFHPDASEMYPAGGSTWVEVEGLSAKLEGALRPGHFRGVTTIVAKLFAAVEPHAAWFGWKDAQQLVIIRKMVRDLRLPVEVIGMPTWREPDGLAGSSRNVYLAPEERRHALCLPRALLRIREAAGGEGAVAAAPLLAEARALIAAESSVVLQYLEAVDLERLEPVEELGPGTMVAAALLVGKVRLIDNVVFP